MSWLIPSALGIAAVAAIAAVALHFIARSRPLAEPLPTARFVPQRPIHARTRSIALSDVLLLVLRVVAIAVIGVAVAGPMLSNNARVTRIFLVDRSRAVANVGEARDSVKALAAAGDVVIPFDSAAPRIARLTAMDSLASVAVPGSLSAAIAAAARAAVRASADADSVELVLVSPLAREEIDDATSKIRAEWRGRIRLVPVAAAKYEPTTPRVEIRAAANDAIVAGLSIMGVVVPPGSGTIRLVRGRLTAADSAWVREPGHIALHWPTLDGDAEWQPRASIDAIGGVTSGSATVVARFPRLWNLDGDAVARWADGEPAVVEHASGSGCVRDVGILIDEASDLTLREPFRRFARSLLAPCGGARDVAPVDATVRASLAGAGALAIAATMRDRSVDSSRWTPWLLVLGALLLTAEMALRRSERPGA